MSAFRQRQVRPMSPTETAWVAGLLEGEGSFFARDHHGKPQGRVSIQMTDRDVLERLAAVVGVGTIHNVNRALDRALRKPCWGWHISAKADVLALIDQIYPWMGGRRRAKMDEVIAVLRPPIEWAA